MFYGGVAVPDSLPYVTEIAVEEQIGADEPPDFFRRLLCSDELREGRHIDAVDIRTDDRRSGGGKIYFFGSSFFCNLNNFFTRIAADDRIVNEQDVIVFKF